MHRYFGSPKRLQRKRAGGRHRTDGFVTAELGMGVPFCIWEILALFEVDSLPLIIESNILDMHFPTVL